MDKINQDNNKEKAPRKYKCTKCGNKFDKEELTTRSNKKYCKTCLEKYIEEKKIKSHDWDMLFEYICELYHIDRPTGMMFRQIKEFKGDEYNYTNIGMYYTLKYYYEILENTVKDNTGIGIIPYFYERAKAYYNKIFDLEEIVDNFENTEKDITIHTHIRSQQIHKKTPLPLNFTWEEDNENK